MLCTKEADEIYKVVEAYNTMFEGRNLEKDIIGDTSGDFKNLLLGLLRCERPALSTPVDQQQAAADAEALHKAGEKKWFGTDESKFVSFLFAGAEGL